MTEPQKALLAEFAAGTDVNVTAQLALAFGGQKAQRVARTILALLKQGMLRHAKGGGLEISDKGREQAKRNAARKQGGVPTKAPSEIARDIAEVLGARNPR